MPTSRSPLLCRCWSSVCVILNINMTTLVPDTGLPVPTLVPDAGLPVPTLVPDIGLPVPILVPDTGLPVPTLVPDTGLPVPILVPDYRYQQLLIYWSIRKRRAPHLAVPPRRARVSTTPTFCKCPR